MDKGAIGVVYCDLTEGALGLSSRLAHPFPGATSVLAATLSRLAQCKNVTHWELLCPPAQGDAVSRLAGEGWSVSSLRHAAPPWRERIRIGRKWSIDGWLGGVGRSCLWDEEFFPADFAAIAAERQARWIVQASASGPLVDPSLIDAIVQRALATTPAPPFMYGAIPPGLAAWALRTDFVAELAEKGVHPGYVHGYRASDPTIDLSEQLFAYKPPIEISRLPLRLLADHQEGYDRLVMLADANIGDALDTARRAALVAENGVPPLPQEIEIEITTRIEKEHRYRPTAHRPDMPVDVFAKIVRQYADATDLARVTLSGHGDPLRHPQWPAILRQARDANPFGLCVVTDALSLDDGAIENLLAAPPDILQVRLDADSRETFALIHGVDGFDQAIAAIERLLQSRDAAKQVRPLVVVSMVRAPETIGEMLPFYDRWTTRADGAFFSPTSERESDKSVLPVAPPRRAACRRLRSRLTLLSNGMFVTCDEDSAGEQVVGEWPAQTIANAWRGDAMTSIRSIHREGRWRELPRCADCRGWHRP